MLSRYNAMLPSTELDSEDLQAYPDPLSTDYEKDIVLTSPALRFEMNITAEKKFYVLAAAVYQQTYAQYDDIVLCWNDIPHISTVEAGDTIFFPERRDITTYLRGVSA